MCFFIYWHLNKESWLEDQDSGFRNGSIKHSLKTMQLILGYRALADKSGNMFDFCGNTGSNRAGAWSRHEFALIFPTTQQSNAFSMSPHTRPIAASGATNVKNVIRFSASVISPFISQCSQWSSRPSNTHAATLGHCPSHQQLTHGHR